MAKTAFLGNILLPDRTLTGGAVVIENESILDILPHEESHLFKGADVHDFGDDYISPGFIDIHTHGALGQDLMDCDQQGLELIALHQAGCGVTGFMGATISAPMGALFKTIDFVKQAAHLSLPSELLGIHVEGPYLNREMRGAHNLSSIREMTSSEIKHLLEALENLKVIVTMAPEAGDNLSHIQSLTECGIVASIGHSNASYEEALESFRKGIGHATHLFNAMSGYDHRNPGVVGAVLDTPNVTAEIICDGLHLHPSAVRLVLSAKGVEDTCLITDSTKACGMGDGMFVMGNIEIEVAGGIARLRDSDTLAGSILTMNQALKNVAAWTRLPIYAVVNMATLNPARVLGLDDKIGSIEKGKQADLAVFDAEFNIKKTVRKGRVVLEKI